MERESFEDEDIAALMNEHFVSIKVDREERPDLDAIYMDAVQAMTGSGGWPMTVFLTPDGRAVLRRHVLPAGAAARPAVVPPGADGHRARRGPRRRDEVVTQGDEDHRAHRAGRAAERVAGAADRRDHPTRRSRGLHQAFDARVGRVRRSAEVPAADDARVRPAVRRARLGARDSRSSMTTLDRMAGRRDLRPRRRRVRPLLDGRVVARAALREDALRQRAARAAVHARVAGHAATTATARVATETLEYLLREMQHAEGGFFSSQDADTEGVEGKFFVWTWDELVELVGRAGRGGVRRDDPRATGRARTSCGVRAPSPTIAAEHGVDPRRARRRGGGRAVALFEVRERRVQPGHRRQGADRVERAWRSARSPRRDARSTSRRTCEAATRARSSC